VFLSQAVPPFHVLAPATDFRFPNGDPHARSHSHSQSHCQSGCLSAAEGPANLSIRVCQRCAEGSPGHKLCKINMNNTAPSPSPIRKNRRRPGRPGTEPGYPTHCSVYTSHKRRCCLVVMSF